MKEFAQLLEEFRNARTIEEREEAAWSLWNDYAYDVYGEDRDALIEQSEIPDPFPVDAEDVEAWAR